MASNLVTTPGSPSADSYGTLAQAEVYYAKRHIQSSWTGTDAVKDRVLQEAARDLDRLIRQYVQAPVLSMQAMAWPWATADDDYTGTEADPLALPPFYRLFSATSGSTTTIVCDTLELTTWDDDYWNAGAVYVTEADDVAPERELRGVTDFVRSTGTLTVAAFSVAIDAGDQFWLIKPAPLWLREAQFEQAYHILENRHYSTGDAARAGIASSSNDKGSVTYREGAIAPWMSDRAFALLFPQIPKEVRIVR